MSSLRRAQAAVPLFALYALVAVFHAEDPRQYVGACQQRDRLREDFGRTVRVSVKSTRATPRKTVDEMESRQLFIGYTVSCSGSMGAGATALAREVRLLYAVYGSVCVWLYASMLLNGMVYGTGLRGCRVG